jgi:hypothetical protein
METRLFISNIDVVIHIKSRLKWIVRWFNDSGRWITFGTIDPIIGHILANQLNRFNGKRCEITVWVHLCVNKVI